MGKIYGQRWEIKDSLVEGGQAHTFLVTDSKGGSNSLYVLKRLKNLNRVERFKREIEAVRNLTHENIVRLIDFDLDAAQPYLVTEYCSGGSLANAAPFWRESVIQVLQLFRQICEGVAYAHREGVTHRDLKPDNIFLRTETGPAVVGDFGICHIVDGERVTLTREAVGSRFYMAPELEDGPVQAVSPKSDTYSLGKILYWLLTGNIFSREKHREVEWDLRGPLDIHDFWTKIYMEHINRLLDLMIVADEEMRRRVDNILELLKIVERLVQKEFTPIGRGMKHPCQYCGYGHYTFSVTGTANVNNFGITVKASADWHILICDQCGHVQMFRVDMAEQKIWWE